MLLVVINVMQVRREKENMEQQKKKMDEKLLYIELIKVISCFFIVTGHTISMQWIEQISNHTIEGAILNAFFLLFRIALPMFFVCSGAVMLRKERSIKYIITSNIGRLLKTYVCWMLLFAIVEIIKMETHPIHIYVNVILKSILFGQFHTWFIITLIGLYLITPFLYMITRKKSLMLYFLILAIAFGYFLPILKEYEVLNRVTEVLENFRMQFVLGYSIFFVGGYYLSEIQLTKKIGRISIAVFLVSTGGTYLFSQMRSLEIGTECQKYYLESAWPNLIMVASAFLAFRYLFEQRFALPEKIQKSILFLSSLGMGIYLFHPMITLCFEPFKGVSAMVAAILVWIISVALMVVIKICIPLKKNPLL